MVFAKFFRPILDFYNIIISDLCDNLSFDASSVLFATDSKKILLKTFRTNKLNKN